MSNRMAEIQNTPQIGLFFIRHHNMRLDRGASCDEPFNFVLVPPENRLQLMFKLLEQSRIANDPVFDRLI